MREYTESSVRESWRRFALGNGSTAIEETLERLNSFRSSSVTREINEDMLIGNTVMDEVVWLDEPVTIEERGVTVAPSVVRGKSLSAEEEAALLGDDLDEPTGDDVRQLLANLNSQYQAAPANLKLSISNRFERNPLLVKLLKRLHPEICQVCAQSFFWKRGQVNRYSEVHHIKELSIGGKDASENCLVLCANCHRKMHYGDINLEDSDYTMLVREGIGPAITVQKNIIRPNSLS